MSDLISGKEALIALVDGEEVEYLNNLKQWDGATIAIPVMDILDDKFEFRLKPRTITLNGIEVPAPFVPKQEDWCNVDIYYLDSSQTDGWNDDLWNEHFDCDLIQFGAWRTKEEIKKVVEALRSIFK